MKGFRKQIRRKGADLWKENSCILHHDNALSHKAITVNEFLAKHSTNIIGENWSRFRKMHLKNVMMIWLFVCMIKKNSII